MGLRYGFLLSSSRRIFCLMIVKFRLIDKTSDFIMISSYELLYSCPSKLSTIKIKTRISNLLLMFDGKVR
jgi:hypothetical protein